MTNLVAAEPHLNLVLTSEGSTRASISASILIKIRSSCQVKANITQTQAENAGISPSTRNFFFIIALVLTLMPTVCLRFHGQISALVLALVHASLVKATPAPPFLFRLAAIVLS